MLTVKGAGILVLTLTAFYYSWNGQYREIRKQKILQALHELFLFVQKNIECYTRPLGEIYRNCSSIVLDEMGFLSYWKCGELQDAVNTLEELPPAAESALKHYAENAGSGYKDMELLLCRDVIGELEKALCSQNEALRNKNKLYRTLPFLFVMSVILLFA